MPLRSEQIAVEPDDVTLAEPSSGWCVWTRSLRRPSIWVSPHEIEITTRCEARAGNVVVVRALTDNATYNTLELVTGRMAKINPGDIIAGVLGYRRALKGFVGDVPESIEAGDRLHLLNLGGLVGRCVGHHHSLNNAIEVEVIGMPVSDGRILNIAEGRD